MFRIKGNTVKILLGGGVIGMYAILFTTGIKHGWDEGVFWAVIILTLLLIFFYFYNRSLKNRK